MVVDSPPVVSRKRRRGLWAGQMLPPTHTLSASASEASISENGDANSDESTDSSGKSKRRKRASSSSAENGHVKDQPILFRQPEPEVDLPVPIDDDVTLLIDTSVKSPAREQPTDGTPGYGDWENLKDMFARAVERYEDDDISETLQLLRAVVHECCRFLSFFQDPSVLFTNAPSPRNRSTSPDALPPSKQRSRCHDTKARSREILIPRSSLLIVVDPPPDAQMKVPELPTAFHSLFGTALFIFGNLVAQDPANAQPGEPQLPCPYWLAALDVFEIGENNPNSIDGQVFAVSQDWRMAVIWGRTIACLADMAVSRAANKAPPLPNLDAEANWPPFAAIASRRPPSTQSISLACTSPHELMLLAIDQFSRGIFHMPHPQHQATCSPSTTSEHFSRPKELFTIASEVLGIAERLENGQHRKYWAAWADSVFSQMKMEADKDVWRGPITRARGRCWLIIGSAGAEPIEACLEVGDTQVLDSEAAEDTRHALTMAISFFERAKGSATSWLDPESEELKPLMTEALLTLANLTVDENKREELYTRAQAESENSLVLCDDKMDESE